MHFNNPPQWLHLCAGTVSIDAALLFVFLDLFLVLVVLLLIEFSIKFNLYDV